MKTLPTSQGRKRTLPARKGSTIEGAPSSLKMDESPPPAQRVTVVLTSDAARLDKALALSAPEVGSRVRWQALIRAGCVERQNAESACTPILNPDASCHPGETYTAHLPAPTPATPEAQAIPLEVIYEDADLLVINKPAGLVVHPAVGHWDRTLVNALLAHCGADLSGIGGVARPGIVHRLDKDTSGLMVVAKNDTAHRALAAQFADRTLGRRYEALVVGVPHPLTGTFTGPLGRDPRARQRHAVRQSGGKPAVTHYRVAERFGMLASHVVCDLETGRTHQIRVHLAHAGHPVLGDPLYGGQRARRGSLPDLARTFPRQALHAAEIHFRHPRTGRLRRFTVPWPEDMIRLRDSLRDALRLTASR